MDGKYEDLAGDSDQDFPEEGPSAPPPGWLDNVTGYDGMFPDQDCADILYPPPKDHVPVPENDRGSAVPEVRVPVVTEDVAREALLQFVGKKWTYSSKPARNMVFKDLRPFTVYRYRLETFTESRSSTWKFEPYTDQFVDGPQYGMSPPPWDVMVQPPHPFVDSTLDVRVPHSSFIKTCHQCQGRGRVRCKRCHGKRKVLCTYCRGNGRARKKRCSHCHGTGRKRCTPCHGKGSQVCSSCKGHKNLMHFIQLTIKRKNHTFEFIPDRLPEFPVKKFEKVSGDPFFVDESVLVYPIVGFPDQEICEMSRKMCEEHLSRFSAVSRILQQRQSIELVPLTHAFYGYNGKDYNYFVYGIENKVYSPKYPSSCCIL
ncbi:hypothetical protein MATL_G00077580 [Megalops atlanticus]|uniref:Protein SSUH2 homolog n=1 Tax=Megalops atlanticus TaxID=7932 RepID=A0A9D3Q816_MEGAT|nr:hypothetical protein MATL_G00077580 [Megalops atlanticus]